MDAVCTLGVHSLSGQTTVDDSCWDRNLDLRLGMVRLPANWKRASLSDAEIAALAGHGSTRTARQHYAGGRHGWTAEFACARHDPRDGIRIGAHDDVTTAPVSARSETMSVVPARAAAPANKSGASGWPAGIPHRVIVIAKQYERVPIIPIIRHDVVPTLSRIDTNREADEAPAFAMG